MVIYYRLNGFMYKNVQILDRNISELNGSLCGTTLCSQGSRCNINITMTLMYGQFPSDSYNVLPDACKCVMQSLN